MVNYLQEEDVGNKDVYYVKASKNVLVEIVWDLKEVDNQRII